MSWTFVIEIRDEMMCELLNVCGRE